MKRRKQTKEERQVTVQRVGEKIGGPKLPDNAAAVDLPNEYNEQPGSGSRIGGERGEQEYGLEGSLIESEKHTVHAPATAPIGGKPVEPEPEPQPYGSVDKEFGGVSEYSAENAGEEENRIQRIESASSRESDLDREDRDVLVKLAFRLKERKDLDLSEVQLKIREGNVTISGKVENDADKTEIREVAEAIPGVRSVDDKLEVAPH